MRETPEWEGSKRGEKPTSLSVVFYRAAAGTVQRLRLLLLRLACSLELLWADPMESPHVLRMSP